MSDYDELIEDTAIPAELMGRVLGAEEETPPEPQLQTSFPAGSDEPLPPDIEEVWGGGKLDGSGQPAHKTARTLIAAWGLEEFRTSAIHRNAIRELEREAKMEPIRAAFIKAKKDKAK